MVTAGANTVSISPAHSQGDAVDVHVGTRLREARERQSLGLSEVAGAIGVTEAELDLFEKGKMRVGAARLHALCQILGQSVSYFFSGYRSENEVSDSDLVSRVSRLLHAFTSLTAPQQDSLCDQASRMANAADAAE